MGSKLKTFKMVLVEYNTFNKQSHRDKRSMSKKVTNSQLPLAKVKPCNTFIISLEGPLSSVKKVNIHLML